MGVKHHGFMGGGATSQCSAAVQYLGIGHCLILLVATNLCTILHVNCSLCGICIQIYCVYMERLCTLSQMPKTHFFHGRQ